MKNGVSLQLKQKQDLSMTAELRQAIEMLQLGAPEIADMVAREVAENPCLDYEGEDEGNNGSDYKEKGNLEREAAGKDGGQMVEWDMAWDQWAIRDEGAGGPAGEMYGNLGGMGGGDDDEGYGWESRAHKDESLQDYLLKQFEEVVEEPKLRFVGRFLIDAIDDAGYLRADMAEVAARLKVSEDLVDDARAIIQTLEPLGVGARDLQECLRLQMHAMGLLDDVMDVCLEHLDWVGMKAWDKIAAEVNRLRTRNGEQLADCDAEEVKLAVVDMQKCNPKPAAGFGTARIDSVVPDVVIVKTADGWAVELNGAAFPKLLAYPPQDRAPPQAGRAAATRGADEAKKFMTERYGRARWLVNALEQRAKTTLAVARAVVAAQGQFFDAGVEFLIPLTLKTVAEGIGVHESTVSRVVNGKFMQTPWGVLGFKYFFASGVGSTGGQVSVAATSVQALINRLVKAENPQKPLSDEQIVKLLKDEGVEVARRTVAKYRGILGIPGTSERRVRG
ncbi:MAG: RNA polymerase sigma-54 factor [Alphaproteobacteria bacterium]|nr:MAG: RNA polymerase sigma-54 factor [Alphaproteobacteria bacterium]